MILTQSHNTSIDSTPNASIQKSSFANLRSLRPPEQIIADGKIHKCDVADLPNGNGRGSYLLHLDRLPAGGFANWRADLLWQKWNAMMCDDAPSENHGGAS